MTHIYFSVSKCMAKANDYSYIPEIVANPFFGKNSAKDLKEKTGQKDPRMTDMPRVWQNDEGTNRREVKEGRN